MALWNPAEGNAPLWLDAKDSSTITIDTGVSNWADKSGNGNDYSQSSTAAQPSYITDDAVRFNGSSQYLEIASRLGFAANPDIIIGLVVTVVSNVKLNDGLFQLGDDILTLAVAGGTEGWSWRFDGGNEVYSAVPTGTKLMVLFKRSSGSTFADSQCFVNGTEVTRTSGVNDTLVPTNTTALSFIGQFYTSGGSYYANAKVHELVVLNTLSDQEKLEGYLAWANGLEGDLPTDHPYKDAAPTIDTIGAVTVTIPYANIDSDLTDFPVTLQLNSSSGLSSADLTSIFTSLPGDTDYSKLIIKQGDTQLYAEVESWDPTNKQAVIHVKVPTISSTTDTILTIDFSSSNADQSSYIGVTGSTAAQQVWDSNFVAVYHMAQDPTGTAPQLLDSTSNEHHGTAQGSMTAEDLVDGLYNKAIEFDGVDDRFETTAADLSSMQSAYTIEALANFVAATSGYDFLLGFSPSPSGTPQVGGWHNSDNIYIGAAYNDAYATDLTVDRGVYHYFSWLYDGSESTVVRDDTFSTSSKGFTCSDLSSSQMLIGGPASNTGNTIIKELRISKIKRAPGWIAATNLSLRDQLISFSFNSTVINLLAILRQEYELSTFKILTKLLQQYDLRYSAIAALNQPYASTFISVLKQKYGNYDNIMAVLEQYYGNYNTLIAILSQEYEELSTIMATLQQPYPLMSLLLARLEQIYSIVDRIPPSILRQKFDIESKDKILSILQQNYSLFPNSSIVDSPTAWVTINGSKVDVSSIEWDYDIDSYCGSFFLTLLNENQWTLIEDRDKVIVHIQGTDHHAVVVSKSDPKTAQQVTYSVETRSPAVLLDSPFAAQVSGDFEVSGTASKIVSDLAALEGFDITWHLDSDPPLTDYDIQVSGSSPLSGIRSIVNELGGRVNSLPDGSVHIVKRHPFDSNKYEETTASYELTTGMDFISLNSNTDKRTGYNTFTLSSENIDTEYSLSYEDISSGRIDIKATKVPWSSDYVELWTSDLSSVSIVPKGIQNTSVTEEVEIVKGVGQVDENCYGVTSWDYKGRTPLGEITITESGKVTTEISGNTVVSITYTTRYWLWETSDTESETVQFILVKP